MTQILAFSGSNSSVSINFALLQHAVAQITNIPVEVFELSQSNIPMYQYDLEKNEGIPSAIHQLFKHIAGSKGLVITVNEHNSYPSAFFKNNLDWLSRIDPKFLTEKKILLMSTSTGKRGGVGALSHAEALCTRFGGEVVATFSLPSFKENFDAATHQITDTALTNELSVALSKFTDALA